MLLILFGLPGSGKNFVGRILQEDFGFLFHDADDDLPDEMREAIQSQQISTPTMRDAHLQNILKRIEDLKQQSEQIAVCGAFFKEHHRRLLSERFPDAVWLWVDTLPQLQRQRLLHRQNHLANLDYAEKIFSEFEPPQNHIIKLENNAGRIGIVQQFQKLLTLYDPS